MRFTYFDFGKFVWITVQPMHCIKYSKNKKYETYNICTNVKTQNMEKFRDTSKSIKQETHRLQTSTVFEHGSNYTQGHCFYNYVSPYES